MCYKTVSLKTPIPGPKSQALLARRKAAVPQGPFNIAPIFVERGEGVTVTDVDGNVFLDFSGGLGSLNAGHANPKVVEAVTAQARKYLHTCFHIAQYEPYVALAEKLNAITPGKFAKKTLLLNSGAEAVENAVKIARYYTKRPAVIGFEHGFARTHTPGDDADQQGNALQVWIRPVRARSVSAAVPVYVSKWI